MKILWIERNHENLTTRNFFMQFIFNVKIFRSTVFWKVGEYLHNNGIHFIVTSSHGAWPNPEKSQKS